MKIWPRILPLAGLLMAAWAACAWAGTVPMRVVYGFDREFPPFSYEDPGGKPVGFDIEIMETIFRGKAVLAMRPLNWNSIQPELSAGSITLTSGMIRTPQRARAYVFSKLPTFDLKMRFFTKVYRRVPNVSFLRGQSVAVEEGSFQMGLLQEFGGINIKSFPSRSLALRALYNEEVDAYCGPDEPSYYFIRKLNYWAITTLGAPLGAAEMRVAVNRDRGDVLRIVDDGLQALISSGEYDRIYRRWFVTELGAQEKDNLIKAARGALISAYAPYGKMNMGAAVLTATGKVLAGSNMENADPRLNLSAVRVAVARSLLENEMEIRAVVLVNQHGEVVMPGAEDFQALYEFSRGILVLSPDGNTPMIAQLLPDPVIRDVFRLELQ
ncbi:MAG: transporter substrate-binding domain-containing protein [Desulfovibrionaceae bacterium]|nr:transporter substrate-binding domain-containing protein [Desulfovibrionaceae bacterium]